MEDLQNATQRAIETQQKLNTRLATLENLIADLKAEIELRNGRISQLETALTLSEAKCDDFMRWSTEVTTQIHNIGMFAAQAMTIARTNMAKHKGNSSSPPAILDSATVLKNMEADIKADEVPSFIKKGPKAVAEGEVK